MAQVRHLDFTNTTNPSVLQTSVPINEGQDYAFQTLSYTFVNADVGTAAGQTADTTSNPTTGFLFAQIKGAVFKNVISLSLVKPIAATHTTVFNYFYYSDGVGVVNVAACATGMVQIGYRIVNTTLGRGVVQSSLYILDSGTDAGSMIAVDDQLVVAFELGNT